MPPRKPLGSYAGAKFIRVLTAQQASQLTAQLRTAISGGTPCKSCLSCAEFGSFMAAISQPRTRPRPLVPTCVAQPVPA